jgi:hypothetical protein
MGSVPRAASLDGNLPWRVLSSAVSRPGVAVVQKHINLLGILHLLWGGLNAILGVALMTLGLGAAAILKTSDSSGQGHVAAGVMAGVFMIIAGALLIWGTLQLLVGVGLRQYRPWARPVTIALSVLNIFFLPFGTAVGVYGLWVLVHDSARVLFHQPVQS